MRGDLAKAIIIALIILIIIAVAVGLVSETLQAGEKYEVFRDLLVILLALAAVTGFAIYYLVLDAVSKKAMEKVKDTIEEEMTTVGRELDRAIREISRERGKSLIAIGLDFYADKDYQRAIDRTREALREAGLDATNILRAKNNLAYYLTCEWQKSGVEQLATEARKLADEVYEKYDPTNDEYNYAAWVETWVFVHIHTAQTQEEMLQLRDKIKKFFTRPDLKTKWALLQNNLAELEQKINATTHQPTQGE